jgi:hypothetical protein
MLHRMRCTPTITNVAFLGIALVLLLSGCGGAARTNLLPLARHAPAQTPSATPTALGVAALLPQPNGPADLTWDPTADNTLTVTLSLTGLAPANPASYPNTPYPAEIASGSCQTPGSVVHQLTAVTADPYGAAASTTTIKGVAGGIPARGWNIILHAPGTTHAGMVLACAPVLNPTASTTQKQSVKTWLHGLTHAHGGEGAYGKAQLSLSGTTLTVSLFLEGLVPGSKHDAHIHSGSCARQGPVVHPLPTITADSSGRAHVVTTIQGVTAIPGDWYIHVHNGTDLTTQAGFQPIACGNVFTRA